MTIKAIGFMGIEYSFENELDIPSSFCYVQFSDAKYLVYKPSIVTQELDQAQLIDLASMVTNPAQYDALVEFVGSLQEDGESLDLSTIGGYFGCLDTEL